MTRSYRIGLMVVLSVASASAVLATLFPPPEPLPAAQDLGDDPLPLGRFAFTERSGRTITDADLGDTVWIAGFVFTRCPTTCPIISKVMMDLQGDLAGTGVRLVSLSVDPEHDTPEVLADFARRYDAGPETWLFLTGARPEVYGLIREGFRLPVQPQADPRPGSEPILHSTRLALVDRGNRVVGFFDATDPEAVEALAARARRLDESWVGLLPAVNASLNGLCTVLLIGAWLLIRSGNVRGHICVMTTAVAVSVLFLASYLLYHAKIGGGVPFQGRGPIRVAYFTILISHVILAAAVLPLIVLTLLRAIRRQFARHARIAQVTFPIWLYVSITGVLVYLMLYQMDVSSLASPGPLPPSVVKTPAAGGDGLQ